MKFESLNNNESPKFEYSPDPKLEEMVRSAMQTINEGGDIAAAGLEKRIKATPTFIMRASESQPQKRYQPGNKLFTYNGVDAEGSLIRETYNDGVAELSDNSVILKNEAPIIYPEGHSLAGEQVKGYYADSGEFIIDQEHGDTYLYNEYVSTVEKVRDELYGIEANDQEWQSGFKLEPVYTFKIPDEIEDKAVVTDGGTEVRPGDGGSVVINTKKGKTTSIQAIAEDWLDRTYVPWDEYQEKLKADKN